MGIQDVDVNAVADAAVANQSGGQGQASPQQGNSGAPSTQSNAHAEAQAKAEAILNLDGASKFKFGGKEWTPEQLQKSMMLHSDYTKKTQAVAQTAKYYDNLDADLDFIRTSPNKQEAVQMFMQTYPKAFHKYLSMSGAQIQQEAENRQMQGQSQAQLPPELMRDLQMVKNYVTQTETKAIEAQLDNTFAALAKKYPDGDEDVVLARASALLDAKREEDPGFQLTTAHWDKLWKASHEKFLQKNQARQKTVVQNQRNANSMAKGPASGGGVPGQAPARMNLKQATEFAVQHFKKG